MQFHASDAHLSLDTVKGPGVVHCGSLSIGWCAWHIASQHFAKPGGQGELSVEAVCEVRLIHFPSRRGLVA